MSQALPEVSASAGRSADPLPDRDPVVAGAAPASAHLSRLARAATDHSPLEDMQGIFTGALLGALGLALLSHLGLLTSGAAGLALIVSYASGLDVSLSMLLVNAPFLVLAGLRMGRAFTIKTLVSVGLLSFLTSLQPHLVSFGRIEPAAGAVMAGLLLGFAVLALFRHRASFGGAGILAILLQDRRGWRAGYTQLAMDLVVLAAALAVADRSSVAYSLISAMVLNLFLAINHRTDRYVAR
ncbi:protein of unknown function DUF161 (plasmid) [Paracoccus denitrificans PD1222]|uniref:YitT family protein n=2 Tax=Paracoccaceae TaxID=31989 RepID=A1BAZ5_PARDP|nr:protein of unknown function DUF161 [Paracoccus denitrificans PD1222]